MSKLVLALLTATIFAAAPSAAQIGAPGAADWVKTPLPSSKSPFDGNIPPGRADDYASIVNLMGTYFIALDAGDLDTYAGVFSPDASLYWIGGVEHGRDEIRKGLANFGTGRTPAPANATSRPRSIHTLGSQRINFTGPDTAEDVTIWLAFSNPDGKFDMFEFGHSYDKYVKIEGKWYFKERRIFNERLSNRALFYPEMGEPDPRALPTKK
jgi:uncharacterized protein (TIGR02246 family)